MKLKSALVSIVTGALAVLIGFNVVVAQVQPWIIVGGTTVKPVVDSWDVGIGTTSPAFSFPFAVHGSGFFAGDLFTAGFTATGSTRVIADRDFGGTTETPTDGILNVNCTANTNLCGQLYTNVGATANGPVLILRSDNTAFDDGVLRVLQDGTAGGAYSIRIDDPEPDIELVESDQVSPAGKFEIAVQGDQFILRSRNAADTGFENIWYTDRLANGGEVGIGTNTPSQLLSVHGNELISGNLSVANITATGTQTFNEIAANERPFVINCTGAAGCRVSLQTTDSTSGNFTAYELRDGSNNFAGAIGLNDGDKTKLIVFDPSGNQVSTFSNARQGVGSSTPAQALGVQGNVLISGDTSTAGLTATGTATLAGGILTNNATSTITNLTMVNATSTSATTTNIYISGTAIISGASTTITGTAKVSGGATFGTSPNIANIGNNGILKFSGGSDYQVPNNRYAFRNDGLPLGGLYFDAVNFQIQTVSVLGATTSAFSVLPGTAQSFVNNTNFGIGTTTPINQAKVVVQGELNGNIAQFSASTGKSIQKLTNNGEMIVSATSSPTITSCGTSPALTAKSNDSAGEVTVGSPIGTSCQLMFGQPKTAAIVNCFYAPETTARTYAVSASSTGFLVGSAFVANDQFKYWCVGVE